MFNKLFSKKSTQDTFWEWFKKNSDAYFHFEKNQDTLFQKLKSELNKINPNLVFEFSPILQDGKRELVISADGIISAFSAVEELVANAPVIVGWHVIAFRQPHKGTTQIKYGNLTVNLNDIFFRFGRDQGKIALELHIRDFYESAEWAAATFILLDNILGEYDTEMAISRIEKKLLNENETNDLYPISELPSIIKNYHQERNN